MVIVMFATPVIFAWCLIVKVRALAVPLIARAISAGKIKFGLSLVAVMRPVVAVMVVALLVNAVAKVSASAMVKAIAFSAVIVLSAR